MRGNSRNTREARRSADPGDRGGSQVAGRRIKWADQLGSGFLSMRAISEKGV